MINAGHYQHRFLPLRHITLLWGRLWVTLFLVLGFLSAPAQAQTIHDLEKQQRVSIKSWLSTDSQGSRELGTNTTVAVGEQVILYIEVTTDRWLTAGTEIGLFDIDNTFVLRRKKLATNFTRQENGTTWSHQRWEITLYPQASAEFVIPPIPVTIQVSAAANETVRGTLLTTPMKFTTSLPSPYLTQDIPWVAASNLTMDQQWTIPPNSELKVGDAIVRTITVSGKDTTAMLLPAPIAATSSLAQRYTSPEVVIDTQVRGEYEAKRVDTFTYIVQRNGELELPAITLQWWNTQQKQLTTLQVSGGSWHIQHTSASFIKAYWAELLILITCLIVTIIIFTKSVRKYRNRPLPSQIAFMIAIKNHQWALANLLLYRKLFNNKGLYLLSDTHNPASNNEESANWLYALHCWFDSLYSVKTTAPSKLIAQKLWRNIKKTAPRLKQLRLPVALQQLRKSGAKK